MFYKCAHCGKKFELDLGKSKKIICHYCGFRIVEKVRANINKKVDAI